MRSCKCHLSRVLRQSQLSTTNINTKCHLSRVLRQSQLSTTNINTKCHLDRVLRVVSRSTTCEWYPHQQLAGGIWTRGIPINNLRMVCGWHPKDTRMLNWVSRSTTCDPKLKSWHRDSNRRPPLKSDWRYCIHNCSQISMVMVCTLIDSAQFCRAELQLPLVTVALLSIVHTQATN